MKILAAFIVILVASSAFANTNAQPSQQCVEQAKQAALALEQVFIAPSNEGSLSGSATVVGDVTYTIANDVTRWVIPVTFVIPVMDQGSNSTTQDEFLVTLGQKKSAPCYHIQTTSLY